MSEGAHRAQFQLTVDAHSDTCLASLKSDFLSFLYYLCQRAFENLWKLSYLALKVFKYFFKFLDACFMHQKLSNQLRLGRVVLVWEMIAEVFWRRIETALSSLNKAFLSSFLSKVKASNASRNKSD